MNEVGLAKAMIYGQAKKRLVKDNEVLKVLTLTMPNGCKKCNAM